jgi:predicted TIM-barrel fold metal-dependent hydrolase
MIARREFVASLAAAAAGLAVAPVASAAGPSALELVDTHTHFYDPQRPEGVPWPSPSDKLLYRRVLPPEYAAMAKPHGVIGTVVIEASPRVADNDWLLELAAGEPFILGIVGNLDPLAPDFAGNLQRLVKNPRFLGIRVSGQQLLEHGAEPDYLAAMRSLADAGRSLDLNGPREYLRAVPALARAVPKLRIILDHVGGAGDPRELPDAWRAGMQSAAENENVHCKVSGLPEQAKGGKGGRAPIEGDYYRPILDVILKSFGPDRLIWGSNWPVSENGAPFEHVVKIARDYFAALTPKNQRAIFSENARRFYRWLRA